MKILAFFALSLGLWGQAAPTPARLKHKWGIMFER